MYGYLPWHVHSDEIFTNGISRTQLKCFARSVVLKKASHELQNHWKGDLRLSLQSPLSIDKRFVPVSNKGCCWCTLKRMKKKEQKNKTNCGSKNLNFLSFSTGKKTNVYNIYVAINVPSFLNSIVRAVISLSERTCFSLISVSYFLPPRWILVCEKHRRRTRKRKRGEFRLRSCFCFGDISAVDLGQMSVL